jgi:hypothetical protein
MPMYIFGAYVYCHCKNFIALIYHARHTNNGFVEASYIPKRNPEGFMTILS